MDIRKIELLRKLDDFKACGLKLNKNYTMADKIIEMELEIEIQTCKKRQLIQEQQIKNIVDCSLTINESLIKKYDVDIIGDFLQKIKLVT